MKGTYILVNFIDEETEISIGSLGKIQFKEGFYLYVGSAMGKKGSSTLINRVKRHLLPSEDKKTHWHIDYFLADNHSHVIKICLIPSHQKLECIIAQELLEVSDNHIKDFGSSDCKCKSHLLFFNSDNKYII
ncbi:MAG: DUF123 domain-containing protein [Candidatus Hermodarchaeota archaeon]